MTALPRDPDNLATKDDVRLLSADVRAQSAELRSEMGELRTEMADLRTELKTDMSQLRTELKAEMGELRTEMHEATTGQTRTLLFGLVGTVVSMSAVQLVSVLAVS